MLQSPAQRLLQSPSERTPQRFSERTSWDSSESAWSHSIRAARSAGRTLLDLTLSNPTLCGFDVDPEAILGALGAPAAMRYDPDPRGIRSAREAVASYYADHHAHVDPDDIVLTTSTSEAYSFLFRLLCDPGDAVLIAQPGYPLFHFLAALDDVQLQHYPLFYDFGWWIDFAELERRITPRTRAILLVHPNNPTGHATSSSERERLEILCTRFGLTLIVDEVFLDYGLDAPMQSFSQGPHPCLTFVLSGLSKVAALPQMKVAWLAAFGPSSERRQALSRLEIIADTFLSMNAPMQHALPQWLTGRHSIQSQIRARSRKNLAILHAANFSTYFVEAGWNAIFKLSPNLDLRGDVALTLLDGPGLIVHPASFYGLPQTRQVIISLIGPTPVLEEGLRKLNAWCESN